ncbi:PaaI family thioesterase [Psychrobacter lutiphocae]|uniref:PaaI family thioesterase n=1 Tax=Psychrobacter lutiphocae TaxID=540500 RepID=UPI0003755517|nr:PaaI family thioesterase [Psychrobacter lutiphocae]
MIKASPEILDKYGYIFQKQNDEVLPAWILKNFVVNVIELSAGQAVFELVYNSDLYRKVPGTASTKLMSGQAIMAAADTLLIYPVLAQVGQEKEMVTLNTNTEFLRPIKEGVVTIKANVIRAGSKVVRGQVEFFDVDDKLCALSTLCYIFI